MAGDRLLKGIPDELQASADRAAKTLLDARHVFVATHIDADGVAAASIAMSALERRGMQAEVGYFKKLDDEAIAGIRKKTLGVAWYTDLGSGSLSKIEGQPAVVSDHHVLDPHAVIGSMKGQAKLTDFSSVLHVNPQLHGYSGATDLSGAGSTFLVALSMDSRNRDLAPLAVLGAVGDLQDQKTTRLEGLNRSVLELAVSDGSVDAHQDIRYFGRETRPVQKLLEYSSDPFLPGITGNEQGALGFLLELGIELKDGERWRTWTELEQAERDEVIEALRQHLTKTRRRPDAAARLVGEVYVLAKEEPGTPLRDAKEFATLLNACGRHGKAEVGMRICRGDRGDILSEGLALLRDHRSALSQALGLAKEKGITRMRNIQYFDAGDEIEDTIIGTVAGMVLNNGGSDRSAPMVAFAESLEHSDVPKLKASARATQDLVSRGVDLSAAMRSAAEKVGGVGGGHNIAAGATIPADRKKDFLSLLDNIVETQILSRARRRV